MDHCYKSCSHQSTNFDYLVAPLSSNYTVVRIQVAARNLASFWRGVVGTRLRNEVEERQQSTDQPVARSCVRLVTKEVQSIFCASYDPCQVTCRKLKMASWLILNDESLFIVVNNRNAV